MFRISPDFSVIRWTAPQRTPVRVLNGVYFSCKFVYFVFLYEYYYTYIPESSNERFFLSVSNFSGLWTEFLKMDGIYENIRNFWDSAGKSEKTYGQKSAGKGRNSAGNGRKYPELQSQQKIAKGCVASEVDGKNMNGRNFLQNLFGQKFVSIEVPGIYYYYYHYYYYHYDCCCYYYYFYYYYRY